MLLFCTSPNRETLYLRLGNGGRFDAYNPSNSILTVAPIESFGFFIVPKLRLVTHCREAPLRKSIKMARTRYKIKQNHIPYFQTATIVGWLPIFTRPETVQILLDSFQWLRENKQFELYSL